MNKLKLFGVLLTALALLFTGCCAGARTVIKSDQAKYDVSFSGALRSSDGKIIPPEDLEVTGTYNYKASGWGMVWSFVPLNSINLSQSINEQVEKAGGNAITDFSISAKQGMLNSFAIFSWLPFWPGYNTVVFSGNIQKVKTAAPTGQAPAVEENSASTEGGESSSTATAQTDPKKSIDLQVIIIL